MLCIMLEVLRSCCTISTWSNKPFPCSFFLLHIIPGLEFHFSIHVLGVLKPCKGCSRSRLPCNWMLCVSPSTSFHLLPPKQSGAHGVVAGFSGKTRSHFQVHGVHGVGLCHYSSKERGTGPRYVPTFDSSSFWRKSSSIWRLSWVV